MSIVVFAATVVAGCRGPSVSNTGYTGTWQRGSPLVTSTLAIAEIDGRLRLRIEVDYDQLPDLVCDWDGACERRFEDGTVQHYRFETREDAETGRLVSTYEIWTEPGGDAPREHYVDELVLDPTGLSLRVQTVERNGERFEQGTRPTRVFRKIDDRVASPPGKP